MANKKFLLLIVLSAIIFTGLIGAITFSNIFPITPIYVTNESHVNLSYGINAEDGLSSITHSWNGTNTTLYDSSLVLFMNFDNRSELGEFTNDSSGLVRDLSVYNNDGSILGANTTINFESLNNITWVSDGKYNGAFNFEGKKDSIILANSNIANFTGQNFTLSIWFIPSTNLSASDPDRSFNLINKKNAFKGYYMDYYTSALGLRFGVQNGSSGKTNNINMALNSLSWYHFVGVFNGTHLTSYLNGSRVDIDEFVAGVFVDEARTLHIGSDTDKLNGWNGTIDDIMIWNRSLTASEISKLYNLQITKYNESYFEYNSSLNTIDSNEVNSFICSKNSTADEFCSSSQTIRELATLKSNFSTPKGNINNNFYQAGEGTFLMEGAALGWFYPFENDYQWHRSTFLNAGLSGVRADMGLDTSWENGTFTTYPASIYNVDIFKDMVKYYHDNNLRIIFIADYMPAWLADNQTWCDANDWIHCPPNNYTRWGDLVVDFLDVVDCDLYPETCLVEVWNEPDLDDFWLSNLSETHDNKTLEYNKLYNATWIAVKAFNSSIKVGGPSVSDVVLARSLKIYQNWLGNFSNQSDFFSFHEYFDDSDGSPDTWYKTNYDYIFNNLTSYGSNITDVFLDEYNFRNATILNESLTNSGFSNLLAERAGLMYLGSLNSYPSNLSLTFFFYADKYRFGDGYWENNWRWEMVTAPQFLTDDSNVTNNEVTTSSYFPTYNVTKNFAHLCPAGATVYVSSSDDASIKQVSCKKGNMYSLIVINTDTNAKNITANLSLTNGSVFYPYNKIQNYETGALLNVGTDGIVQLGVLDSYETLYLSSATSDTKLLSNRFKLDEYNGNTVYDAMYNTSNGTRSGADWETDGIWNTLNGISHYTFNAVTGLFTILTSDNLFSYMALSWSESSISMMRTNFTAGIDNVSSKVPVLFLILIIVVILSVLAVLTIVFYALMNKVNSSSLGFLKGGI